MGLIFVYRKYFALVFYLLKMLHDSTHYFLSFCCCCCVVAVVGVNCMCMGVDCRLIVLQEEDIRLDPELSAACTDDIQELCANIKPGNAEVQHLLLST
jgi:hypothetical protein